MAVLHQLGRILTALPVLFWIPVMLVLVLGLLGAWVPQLLMVGISQLNHGISQVFGGFYLWFVWGTLLVFIAIGLSPLGSIRLGGSHCRPEHSTFSWVAMLFCAGMGTGLMFWGAAEPLYHFMNPPLEGAITFSQAKNMAFRYTYFHWGLHPWGVYGMTALAIGFLGFNLNKGIYFSSFLHQLPGSANSVWRRWVPLVVDLFTVVAIIFGVSATIGMGVLQLQGGLKTLLHWQATPTLLLGLLGVSTGIFIVSALKGIQQGIKVLSLASVWLSLGLLLILICLGPWPRMWESLVGGGWGYISQMIPMSLGLGAFREPHWVADWTVKYWSWWIAWAPFVGLFIATISRGRTIRQLMWGVLIVPTFFSVVWFTVFGQAAISSQLQLHLFGDRLNLHHVDVVLFQLLEHLTHSPLVAWMSWVLIGLNFINSADSATYTLACLSTRHPAQPPAIGLQLAWGLLFSGLAGVLLLTGGLPILQEVTLITVLPFTLLLLAVFAATLWSLVRYALPQRILGPRISLSQSVVSGLLLLRKNGVS